MIDSTHAAGPARDAFLTALDVAAGWSEGAEPSVIFAGLNLPLGLAPALVWSAKNRLPGDARTGLNKLLAAVAPAAAPMGANVTYSEAAAALKTILDGMRARQMVAAAWKDSEHG